MRIRRSQATASGILAIATVILVQAFNSVACYNHTFTDFIVVLAWFVAIPLVPAFIALATANPLRAVASSAFFVPWLIFAYVVDCVMPYTGGGASMIYVAVLLWGTPSAIVGALLGGPLSRLLGLEVEK